MRLASTIALCVVLSACLAGAHKSQQSQASDWVHIDGSKNPELIPEWNVWRTAFRRIADGPVSPEKGRKLIPLNLQDVFSEQETLLLLREGEAEVQRFDECGAKVDKLRERKESREVIIKLNDDIVMECRWQTIHARDRVVAALSDASRLALRQWVESLKAGASITIHKNDLARFRLPE